MRKRTRIRKERKARKLIERAIDCSDPDKAISYCFKALKVLPRFYPAYTVLGGIYLDKHEPDIAYEFFKQAMGIYPNDPMIYLGVSHVFSQKKELEKAVVYYKTAVKMGKCDILILEEVGRTIGDMIEQRHGYDTALEFFNDLSINKNPFLRLLIQEKQAQLGSVKKQYEDSIEEVLKEAGKSFD